MIIPFANMGSYSSGPIPEYGNDEYTTVLIHGESNLEDHSYVYSSDPHTIGGDGYTSGYADNAIQDDDGCIEFSGPNDTRGVVITNSDNDAWTFGSGDFTVEAWVKCDNVSVERQIICAADRHNNGSGNYASPVLISITSGGMYFFVSYNGTSWGDFRNTAKLTVNTWYHVAISRSGNTFRVFLNGVQTGTWTSSSSMYAPSQGWRLGGNGNTETNWFDGKIDEFRISKGIARYTSNFTPRTIPFGTGT